VPCDVTTTRRRERLNAVTEVSAITTEVIEGAAVRRDPIVIAVAILGNVTGIICLTLAIDSDPLVFGIYGVFRITASYGLFRMKTYGLMLERVSALLWIAIPVFFVVLVFFFSHRFPPRPVVAVAVLSGIVSSCEIWYFARSDVKARFAKRGQAGAPFPPLAKAVWFAGQLVFLSCLSVVSPRLLLKEFLTRDEMAQRRTMADMRTISMAVDARWVEEGELPFAESIDAIASKISPTYLKQVPLGDGWGSPFRYVTLKMDPKAAGPDRYVIISAGKDGQFEFVDPKSYTPKKNAKASVDRRRTSTATSCFPMVPSFNTPNPCLGTNDR
jgi:hypothetical protein